MRPTARSHRDAPSCLRPDPKTWRWMKPRVPTCSARHWSSGPQAEEENETFSERKKKDFISIVMAKRRALSKLSMKKTRWNFSNPLSLSTADRLDREPLVARGNGESDILLSRQLARYVRNVCQRRANACGGTRALGRRVPATFSGVAFMNLHTAVEWNEPPLLVEGRPFRFCICWWHAPRKGLRDPSAIHHSEKRANTPTRSTVPQDVSSIWKRNRYWMIAIRIFKSFKEILSWPLCSLIPQFLIFFFGIFPLSNKYMFMNKYFSLTLD